MESFKTASYFSAISLKKLKQSLQTRNPRKSLSQRPSPKSHIQAHTRIRAHTKMREALSKRASLNNIYRHTAFYLSFLIIRLKPVLEITRGLFPSLFDVHKAVSDRDKLKYILSFLRHGDMIADRSSYRVGSIEVLVYRVEFVLDVLFQRL